MVGRILTTTDPVELQPLGYELWEICHDRNTSWFRKLRRITVSSISLNRKWVYFLLQSRFKVGMLRYINLQYIIILSRQVCDTSMVKWSSRLLSMLKALVEGPDYAFPCIPLRASGAGSIPVRRILFLQYPQWFFFWIINLLHGASSQSVVQTQW